MTDVHAPAQVTAPPGARDLVQYSIRLGTNGLSRGGGSEAGWRIWVHSTSTGSSSSRGRRAAYGRCAPTRVLDLAGPKLLACWLAENTCAEIVATDLWETEIARWRRLVRAVDRNGQRFGRLVLETADGTDLAYADASFDAAVSVSVIEHIPDDGDAAAIIELARVLRPGGRLVLTFPYGARAEDVHVKHDLYGQRYQGVPLFFQRRYAPETVESRLLSGGQFEVVDRAYWEKHSIQSAQARLHSWTPSRWGLGRALGPLLAVIGTRALTPRSPEDPGADGVLGLVLRRR